MKKIPTLVVPGIYNLYVKKAVVKETRNGTGYIHVLFGFRGAHREITGQFASLGAFKFIQRLGVDFPIGMNLDNKWLHRLKGKAANFSIEIDTYNKKMYNIVRCP